jgi:hypothetical protein
MKVVSEAPICDKNNVVCPIDFYEEVLYETVRRALRTQWPHPLAHFGESELAIAVDQAEVLHEEAMGIRKQSVLSGSLVIAA